jgi:hypothetical protein
MQKIPQFFVLLTLLAALLLTACQGQISIDVDGGNGDDAGQSGSVSSQTFFLLLIVLLVAMVAMILVAVSR